MAALDRASRSGTWTKVHGDKDQKVLDIKVDSLMKSLIVRIARAASALRSGSSSYRRVAKAQAGFAKLW